MFFYSISEIGRAAYIQFYIILSYQIHAKEFCHNAVPGKISSRRILPHSVNNTSMLSDSLKLKPGGYHESSRYCTQNRRFRAGGDSERKPQNDATGEMEALMIFTYEPHNQSLPILLRNHPFRMFHCTRNRKRPKISTL